MYSDLVGIPFRYGGRDETGMDCWGVVVEWFRRMPRYCHNNRRYKDPTQSVQHDSTSCYFGRSLLTTGRTMCDGYFSPKYTRWVTVCKTLALSASSPVFGFRSYLGKLLLEISTRSRFPAGIRIAVAPSSTVTR